MTLSNSYCGCVDRVGGVEMRIVRVDREQSQAMKSRRPQNASALELSVWALENFHRD
jgi:hypothetical protein